MARKPEPKKGLGRGLSALLGDLEETEAGSAGGADETPGGLPVATLPIDRIHPNPAQPRRRFDEAELDDLARSIAERGVIQPVIVRPHPDEPEAFQIVAGERRWRAAQRAQLHDLPVVIRTLDDRDVLELAIIENVQRADLNAIEEAAGYAQLIEKFSYTQDALAKAIGKSRSHLANTLRLLQLPDDVQAHVRDGRLTAGHARALVTAPNASELAKEAVAKGLTVRQVEQAARKPAAAPRAAGGTAGASTAKDADTRLLEGDLSAAIGMRVEIRHVGADGAGELRITYRSLDDLDRLCQRLAD